MNKQDIIRMAREANILELMGYDNPHMKQWQSDVVRELERFAALVAAAAVEQERKEFAVHAIDIARKAIEEEREACAKVCEGIERLSEGNDDPPPYRYYEAILSRGEMK
jgi:hypothetical protein